MELKNNKAYRDLKFNLVLNETYKKLKDATSKKQIILTDSSTRSLCKTTAVIKLANELRYPVIVSNYGYSICIEEICKEHSYKLPKLIRKDDVHSSSYINFLVDEPISSGDIIELRVQNPKINIIGGFAYDNSKFVRFFDLENNDKRVTEMYTY